MMYHDYRLSARESGPSVDSTGQHDYTQRRTATVLLDVMRHRGLAGVRERPGIASLGWWGFSVFGHWRVDVALMRYVR